MIHLEVMLNGTTKAVFHLGKTTSIENGNLILFDSVYRADAKRRHLLVKITGIRCQFDHQNLLFRKKKKKVASLLK